MKMKSVFTMLLLVLMAASTALAAEDISKDQMRELFIQGIKTKPSKLHWNPAAVCNIREITIPDQPYLMFIDDDKMVFMTRMVYDTILGNRLESFEVLNCYAFKKVNGKWEFQSVSKATDGKRGTTRREVVASFELNDRQAREQKSHILKKVGFDKVYQAKPARELPDANALVDALVRVVGNSEKTFDAVMGPGMAARTYDIVIGGKTLLMRQSEWLGPDKFYVPANIIYKTLETKNGDQWLGSWSGLYGLVYKKGDKGFYLAGCKPLGKPKGGPVSKANGKKETYHDKFVKAGRGV